MGLGDDEVGGDQWNSGPESFAEETIRLGMVLVAPAAQRDPAAAIDEQPSGSGGRAGGTVPAVPPPTPRSNSRRSARRRPRERALWEKPESPSGGLPAGRGADARPARRAG